MRPFGKPEVPRLPPKLQGNSLGARGTRQTKPRPTSDPMEGLKCRACHANSKESMVQVNVFEVNVLEGCVLGLSVLQVSVLDVSVLKVRVIEVNF